MVKRFSQRGFTLVELIIVIAIGGLITLMAFYGISQGNRNKRDDARKADANRYLLAAEQWVSENNGAVLGTVDTSTPDADAQAVLTNYITAGGGTFKDPNGNDWMIKFATGIPALGPKIKVFSPATCNSSRSIVQAGAGDRQIAVAVALEDNVTYCVVK